MTVKEFLQSVRNQDGLLRAYEQELDDLRRRAYNICSCLLYTSPSPRD